jgi:hypothetical protein
VGAADQAYGRLETDGVWLICGTSRNFGTRCWYWRVPEIAMSNARFRVRTGPRSISKGPWRYSAEVDYSATAQRSRYGLLPDEEVETGGLTADLVASSGLLGVSAIQADSVTSEWPRLL